MKPFLKGLLFTAVAGGAYVAVPREIRIQLPSPRMLIPTKDLKTVSLDEAIGEQPTGFLTVTFLYLTDLPPNIAVELSDDIKAWRKKGVAVRAFSINPVPMKNDVAKYIRDVGLDITPVWIEMPDGAACAFNQMAAVKYFTHRDIDPAVTIPFLALALTDRGGNVMSSYAVTVPNGGEIDPDDLKGALMPFNNSVSRAAREKP